MAITQPSYPIATNGLVSHVGAYTDQMAGAAPINMAALGFDVTGATSVHAAVQTAMGDAVAAGRPLYMPKGCTPGLGARVTMPSGLVLLSDPGAWFLIRAVDGTAGTAMLYGAGSISARVNLTASTAAGATTVALPAGEVAAKSIIVGSILGFECTTVVYGAAGRSFERRKVTRISGDTVTLDAPLEYAYTTGASAQYHVVSTPWRGRVEANFRMLTSLTETSQSYVVRIEEGESVEVKTRSFGRLCGGVVLLNQWKPEVDVRWDSLPHGTAGDGDGYTAPYTYGCVFAGATREGSAHVVGADCRHGFTTLSDERSGSIFWGGPQKCRVSGVGDTSSTDSYMFFDVHEFGEDITFENCHVHGGYGATIGDAGGFQDRAVRTRFINCSARNVRRGLVFNASRGGVARDCEFSKCSQAAMTFGSTATDNAAVDCRFFENDATCVQMGGTRNVMVDPVFERNNTNTMIQDTGVTNGRVIRPYVPHSSVSGGTQNTCVLNASAGMEVIDASCPGFGNTTPFFGNNAAARIRGTKRDIRTVASAAALPLDGDGLYKVSGTTTITSITGVPNGGMIQLWFTGALTLTNGANLKLAGAVNFVTTADDVIELMYDGTTFVEIGRSVN